MCEAPIDDHRDGGHGMNTHPHRMRFQQVVDEPGLAPIGLPRAPALARLRQSTLAGACDSFRALSPKYERTVVYERADALEVWHQLEMRPCEILRRRGPSDALSSFETSCNQTSGC